MTNLSFAQLEQLVAQAGGTPNQQVTLAAIAAGVESGGNPTAQNPTSTASGLWQELTTTWAGNGGTAFAPTAAQATPLQQAQVAVDQSINGYQPWAPDLGGAYGASGTAGNPQTPAPGSPVANYLASNNTSDPASTTSGGSGGSGSGGSSTTSGTTFTGVAGVLQQMDKLLEPAGVSLGSTLTSLGTANILQAVETLVIRGFFAVGFLVLTYVGVKQITGGGGGSTIVEEVQSQQRIGNERRRVAVSEAETQRRSLKDESLRVAPKVPVDV